MSSNFKTSPGLGLFQAEGSTALCSTIWQQNSNPGVSRQVEAWNASLDVHALHSLDFRGGNIDILDAVDKNLATVDTNRVKYPISLPIT